MENCWYYKGQCIQELPEGAFGFLYKIITYNEIGLPKYYFGKKQLHFKKKVKLPRKARLNSENKRKRIDYKVSESDWRDYYGSSKELLKWIEENGTQDVYREILSFHNTKIDLTYREMELLVKENVLFREDCYNSNILSKFFRGKITPI